MKKVTGKEKSQDFTDDDLRTLMRDIERRENEFDAEFWEDTPDETQQNNSPESEPKQDAETDPKPNSPEDLGFVKDDKEVN